MTSPIIVALDMDLKSALEMARKLDPFECKVKVGSQLFTSSGPMVIYELNKLGFDIFLDLKFHDIPNTVYRAIQEACKLEIWMVNVHCSGGKEMLRSARKSVSENKSSKSPLLVGVTLLTSIDAEQGKEIGIKNTKDHTISLAKLAKDNGMDGVVCSPHEVKEIKNLLGEDFITVTPGIRSSDLIEDQKRFSSAKEALRRGSDYIVVGRPITSSPNPVKSVKSLLQEIKS